MNDCSVSKKAYNISFSDSNKIKVQNNYQPSCCDNYQIKMRKFHVKKISV